MSGIPESDLKEDFQYFSDALSKGVRTLAFGVIAALWAILTADRVGLREHLVCDISTATIVAAAFITASLTLLFDILQYCAAFWLSRISFECIRAAESPGYEFYYDRECLGGWGYFLYRANGVLLVAKVVVAILAGMSLVAVSTTIQISG